MAIDVRTAYLLIGLLYLILPLTVLFVLGSRKQSSITLWGVGGVSAGLGVLLFALRPLLEARVSPFITFTLTNVLMVAGYIMRFQSLRIDMQKPYPTHWLIAFVLLFALGFEFIRSVLGLVALRMEFAYSSIGVSIFFIVVAAYQYEKKFLIKQIRFIWISYFALGTVSVLRALLIAIGLEEPVPFNNSLVNSAMVFTGILAVIYSNVAYVGVILAQTERERLTVEKKNNRLIDEVEKQQKVIKDLMRVQAFSVVGSYGSTVVHEILQPLTAMRFALENLKIYLTKQSVDITAQERIQAVDSSATRAIGVVETLRNFMVEREVKVAPVSLNTVLDESLSMIEKHAQKLNVNISIDAISQHVMVMADHHQLQRVLFNLMNNALAAIDKNLDKNAPRNIAVKVRYIQRKDFVLIKVIDSGIGLNAKNQSEIFEWLATSTEEGMGIGLALSKMLVENWRGQITAYDADPRVDGLSGAVFELKLLAA